MNSTFPDLRFEAAVATLVSAKNIMFGSGTSSFHVQVPDERDAGSIFSSAHAEAQFYALVGYVKNTRAQSGAAQVFSGVAYEFLQAFDYSMEVAHWIAYANALIVGVSTQTRWCGVPADQTRFVVDWLGAECAMVADESNTDTIQKELA